MAGVESNTPVPTPLGRGSQPPSPRQPPHPIRYQVGMGGAIAPTLKWEAP